MIGVLHLHEKLSGRTGPHKHICVVLTMEKSHVQSGRAHLKYLVIFYFPGLKHAQTEIRFRSTVICAHLSTSHRLKNFNVGKNRKILHHLHAFPPLISFPVSPHSHFLTLILQIAPAHSFHLSLSPSISVTSFPAIFCPQIQFCIQNDAASTPPISSPSRVSKENTLVSTFIYFYLPTKMQTAMSQACLRRPVPYLRLLTSHLSPQHLTPWAFTNSNILFLQRQSALLSPTRKAVAGVIIGAVAAAAGVLLGQLASPGNGSGQPCESCSGRGWVDCSLCQHWDYSAVNRDSTRALPRCSACSGTLRTRCPRCGGRGMGIPTLARSPVPVRVQRDIHLFSARSSAPFVAPIAAVAAFLRIPLPSRTRHHCSCEA